MNIKKKAQVMRPAYKPFIIKNGEVFLNKTSISRLTLNGVKQRQ